MALSLFGGKKHLHHFVAEQDVAKELFALLVEAKTMYLRDVVTGNKQYYRYVEDFVNSHRYIDCDHAVCRNCHEMNIHIVKGLLNDCSTYRLQLVKLQKNTKNRNRRVWWIFVHVIMREDYTQLFDGKFEKFLTELHDTVMTMLHDEYTRLSNKKK